MPSVHVRLNISADEILRWYRGSARTVSAYTIDGKKILFPASALQKLVTRDGVRGTFELCFSSQRRFVSLRRLPSTRTA